MARLRTLLGSEAIKTIDRGYRLDPASADLDSVAFEEGIARGRDLLGLGQGDRAAHALGQTLALWRGAPYPDLEEVDQAIIEGSRLLQLRLQAE